MRPDRVRRASIVAAARPARGGGDATADHLRKAIDWAATENRRPGSPLIGKIALDRVAVMGQSCGGFLALELGGGEFANVASNWLRWQLKRDRQAARMFVGKGCGLCTNPNWDTASKRLG